MRFATPADQTNLYVMIPRRRSAHLPVAALAGLAACFVLASDSAPDPLLKLRGEWRAQVQKDTKPLREKYAESLQKMESELAAGGDYTGAARARRERRRVAENSDSRFEKTQPAKSELAADEAVELSPKAAGLSGGVVFDTALGILKDWGTAGAAAVWQLPAGLKPGGYDVELTWSCAPDAGGEFLIKEDRHTLRRAVKPTAGWENFQTEVAGTLRVLANSRLLELSALTVKAPGLFQLKSVRLLPVLPKK